MQAPAIQQSEPAPLDPAGYAPLETASRSVRIEIYDDDLVVLKENNYILCFAKKVESNGGAGGYDVVWRSLGDYLQGTILSWTPQFQLFGTKAFLDSAQVEVLTEPQDVGLGQQCVLDQYGMLRPPSTGGPATAITLVNQYGTVRAGLNQISTLNGSTLVTPLHVTQSAILIGQSALTPIETLLVWFEQNAGSSTMFSTTRSMSVEIDLTATNSATRLYQNQYWSTPP